MEKVGKRASGIIVYSMVKILFILLLMVVILPNRINAASDNLYIGCDEGALKSGQIANCYIKIRNYSGLISTFSGVLSLSDSIPLKSVTKDSIWEGAVSNGVLDLYSDINKTGNINLVSFEFQVPSSVNQVKVTLSNLILADDNFVNITENFVTGSVLKIEKTFDISSAADDESGDGDSGVVDPGNNEPDGEELEDEESGNNEQPTIQPTTTEPVTTQTSTTKQNSGQSTNVGNNPQTGLNPMVTIILVITSLVLILLVKKGVNNE